MPRGGAPTFTYSLPAIYLAIPGTLITAAQHNTPLEDIASTFNTVWPVNLGGTGGTSAAAILSGDNTYTGANAFNGAFALNGSQSETIAATTNNLSLSATSNHIAITLTGDQTLNGLTGGADGRIVVVRNVDTTETLTIAHDASGSTAANRFALPADQAFAVMPGQSVTLRYSSSRWRLIAQTHSVGSGTGSLLRVDGDGSQLTGIVFNVPAGLAKSINISSNGPNPNFQIGYNIEDMALKNSGGSLVFSTMSGTLDITTSGVNGLDTGTEASNTWYYIWAIAQSGGTGALLLSASSTTPTLPSGYDYSALVGAVRNNASSNFIPFFQYGNSVSYYAQQNVLSAGQATTETAIDYSSFVPPIARRLTANVEAQQTDTTLDSYAALRHVAGSTNDFIRLYVGVNTAGNRNFNTSHVQIPYTGNFFYAWSTSSAGRFLKVDITGFTLPFGGG